MRFEEVKPGTSGFMYRGYAIGSYIFNMICPELADIKAIFQTRSSHEPTPYHQSASYRGMEFDVSNGAQIYHAGHLYERLQSEGFDS